MENTLKQTNLTLPFQFNFVEDQKTNTPDSRIKKFSKYNSDRHQKALSVRKAKAASKLSESYISSLLKNYFGEMFVHKQKSLHASSKSKLDYYVYSPSGNFGVKLINPAKLEDITSEATLMHNNYKSSQEQIYIVVTNPAFSEADISFACNDTQTATHAHVSVVSIENFTHTFRQNKKFIAMENREVVQEIKQLFPS